MCHDPGSSPAVYGSPRNTTTSTRLTLQSLDGATFSAFLARPATRSRTAVVILPDMRGLHRFYEELAVHLAEQGNIALAIDYFGRTADSNDRSDPFPYMEHVMRVTRESLDADLLSAANYLRGLPAEPVRLFVLGFCFGGRQAFLASRPELGFNGVIGFYGAPGVYPNGAAGPTQLAGTLSAPILGLFGEADHGISPEELAAFDAALTTVNVEHEFVVYANAPHGFFDTAQAQHRESCDDAWRRVLAFTGS